VFDKLRPRKKLLQEITMKRTLLHSFALAAVLTVATSTAAFAGPPWISIEYPANPFDATSRGAFLTVRTYHHRDFQSKTVTGTAEGVVDGKRQSMRLDIRPGSQPGMYVVRWQHPATAGVSEATAVVEISPSGGVAGVTVPTRAIGGGWVSPRAVATSEIDALLQGRALASAGVSAQTAH